LEKLGDIMLYYSDELLNLDGFPDENKNKQIISELPYDLSFEDIHSIFKINYDDKIKEDFKILENFKVYPDKNSFDAYNKANGDLFITSIYANSPGFFEAFGDKINSEILASALYRSSNLNFTVEEFQNYLT